MSGITREKTCMDLESHQTGRRQARWNLLDSLQRLLILSTMLWGSRYYGDKGREEGKPRVHSTYPGNWGRQQYPWMKSEKARAASKEKEKGCPAWATTVERRDLPREDVSAKFSSITSRYRCL